VIGSRVHRGGFEFKTTHLRINRQASTQRWFRVQKLHNEDQSAVEYTEVVWGSKTSHLRSVGSRVHRGGLGFKNLTSARKIIVQTKARRRLSLCFTVFSVNKVLVAFYATKCVIFDLKMHQNVFGGGVAEVWTEISFTLIEVGIDMARGVHPPKSHDATFPLPFLPLPSPSPSLPFSLRFLPPFFLFFPFPLPFPFLPFPSLPLEVRPPQIQLGGRGSALSSPSGVRGGAPAEIEFGAF